MKEYSYIGVAEDLVEGTKFIVKSNGYNLHEKNIVMFVIGDVPIYAEVLKAAYLRIGGNEEAMLTEFGEIHKVEKIYGLAWDLKKEEETDGN